MNIETAEDEIVAQLQLMITDADVTIIALPEEDTEIQPAYGKRKVIVAFSGEDSDGDDNTSVVIQNTTATFGVLLQGRKLRGDTGLYALAEAVKLALTGFKPTDCRELTYFAHKFLKNEKKVFEYIVEFKTQGTRVQAVTEDVSGPDFKKISFIEPE